VTVIGTEIRVQTGLGWRVVDILAQRNGVLVGFETKLGGSVYLASQRAKDYWIARIGGQLADGSPIQFPTVLIRG